MSILKVIGKIGAIAAGGAALILAGKSELGSSLFSNKDGGVDTDDLTQVPVMPEQTEEQTPEVVEETAEEEEETPE